MRTLHTTLLAALALSLLAPAVASAREIEVFVGPGAVYARAPSVDAINREDAIVLTDVGAAVELLELPYLDGVFLDGRLVMGGADASNFNGQIETDLRLRSGLVGVAAVRTLVPHVRAHVRVAGGVTEGRLDMTTTDLAGQQLLRDDVLVHSVYAGGGLEAFITPGTRLALALRTDVGYLDTGCMTFSGQPVYPDDGVARLPTVAAPLGAVDVSGWTFRILAVARF